MGGAAAGLPACGSCEAEHGSEDHQLEQGGEGIARSRPKARLRAVATTGTRREQACQPERSGGKPEGPGAPAERLGPQRSPAGCFGGRLSGRGLVLQLRVAERPHGAATVALAARTSPGLVSGAARAACSDEGARCGRGGRPPQGAARRVGAGGSVGSTPASAEPVFVTSPTLPRQQLPCGFLTSQAQRPALTSALI